MSDAAGLDRPSPRRVQGLLRSLWRSRDGVSATEFALLAPVLVLGAFATADAGMAIYERMMIGQALRAAAHQAVAGADENEIRTVLEEVASQNFTIASGDASPADALVLAVSSYCACPGDTIVQVDCTAICQSGIGATPFVRLTATKTFDGVFLPEFGLEGAIDVVAE